jgi:NAD(P)-dependent dehydrogenase (short-subunit alcohol dehydrogenase family)
VLLAGAPGDSLPAAVRSAFVELGARVWGCELLVGSEPAGEEEVDAAVASALAQGGRIEMLIVDGGGAFAAAGAGRDGLRVCLEAAWNVTRAVINGAFMPAGEGGRIVYLAPAASAGSHADAARAGLENLARTLSIEWARHGVTTVAIGPGGQSASELAALTAYLASPAGAYFSGCLLDLSGANGAPR